LKEEFDSPMGYNKNKKIIFTDGKS